jgi:hypothetical protein
MKKPAEVIFSKMKEIKSILIEKEKRIEEKESKEKIKLQKRRDAFSKLQEHVILPALKEIMNGLMASSCEVTLVEDKGDDGEPGHSLKIYYRNANMKINFGFFLNITGNYIFSSTYMSIDEYFDESEVKRMPKAITVAMVNKEIDRSITRLLNKIRKKL